MFFQLQTLLSFKSWKSINSLRTMSLWCTVHICQYCEFHSTRQLYVCLCTQNYTCIMYFDYHISICKHYQLILDIVRFYLSFWWDLIKRKQYWFCLRMFDQLRGSISSSVTSYGMTHLYFSLYKIKRVEILLDYPIFIFNTTNYTQTQILKLSGMSTGHIRFEKFSKQYS